MRYAEDRTHKCHAYGKQRFGNIVYTNRCKKKEKEKEKRRETDKDRKFYSCTCSVCALSGKCTRNIK